jgi:uracil-DNA glycosylase
MPFRTPNYQEILNCNDRIKYIQREVLPYAEAVILTGKTAFAAWVSAEQNDVRIIDHVLSAKFTVKDNLGWHINLTSKKPAYFIYHPSYIERQGRSKIVTQPWIDDIKAVRDYLNNKTLKINTDRKIHDHGEKNA